MKFKIFDEISSEYLGTILNFMDSLIKDIEFGMFDENGEEIVNPEDFYENTRIQSPEDTIRHKKGNSVDQTNLIYWLLKDNGLKPQIYYVEYTNKDKISPSHMFVLFDYNGNTMWYENILNKAKGIHEYKNQVECFNDIKKRFCPPEYLDTCKVYQIKDLQEGTNPNQVLNRKIVRLNDKPQLFLVSENEINTDKELMPTIPSNYLTEYGYADTRQERITVYPTIKDALYSNEFDNLKNKVYHVYEPIYNCTLYRPKHDESPTASITKEIWIQEPIKVKEVGKIKLKNFAKDNLKEYKYGTNNIGKLKSWDYDILEGNLVKDSINHKNKYCVIDSNKKIVFRDNFVKCEEYIKSNNYKDLKCIRLDTYKYLTDKDMSYLFKIKDEGLKIVYKNDENYNCMNVKVIDCKTNEEIDSELCEDMSEVRYAINCFRNQYKIRKVEKQ